jgi:uncharacterized protein YbjT (DUF2867 family)
MMQITVLGATRPIGAHAVVKALDRGYTVVVLVRKGRDALPSTINNHAKAQEHLKVITGDATNRENLIEATNGSEAVLNFLGSRGAMKTTVTTDATKVPLIPPHPPPGLTSDIYSRSSWTFSLNPRK